MSRVTMVYFTDRVDRVLIKRPEGMINKKKSVVLTDAPYSNRETYSRREINVCYDKLPPPLGRGESRNPDYRPLAFHLDVHEAFKDALGKTGGEEMLILGSAEFLLKCLRYTDNILHCKLLLSRRVGTGYLHLNHRTWKQVGVKNSFITREYNYERAIAKQPV